MKRRTAPALILGLALLTASAGAGQALAQDRGTQDRGGQWNDNGDQGWQSGQTWHDRGGRFGRTDLEGRWVSERATSDRQGRPDYGYRGFVLGQLLPDFLRINQNPNQIRIADFRNNTIQQIVITGPRRFDRNDSQVAIGQWRGRKLEVQGFSPRGGRMTQTFSLENRGHTLVVQTRIERRQSGRAFEMEKVYHRA